MMLALKVVSLGGNFILKVFTTVTKPMVDLVYAISCCFERVTFFKPIARSLCNKERYLICQNYIINTRKIADNLSFVLKSSWGEMIPSSFMYYILKDKYVRRIKYILRPTS